MPTEQEVVAVCNTAIPLGAEGAPKEAWVRQYILTRIREADRPAMSKVEEAEKQSLRQSQARALRQRQARSLRPDQARLKHRGIRTRNSVRTAMTGHSNQSRSKKLEKAK